MKHYDDTGRMVATGYPTIDWLTLTTYDADFFDTVDSMLRYLHGASITKVKVGSYVGMQYGHGVKLVSGYQNKQPHYMVIASAYEAHQLYLYMRSKMVIDTEKVSCTRMDIQVTNKPIRGRKRLEKIGIDLQSGKFGVIKSRRTVEVRTISSSSGDTIYIGKPSSEIMTRIYDKKLIREDKREEKWERYEVQYKKDTAQGVWKSLNEVSIGVSGIKFVQYIRGNFERIPEEIQKKLSLYKWKEEIAGTLVTRAIPDNTKSSKLKWLKRMGRAISAAVNAPYPDGYYAMEFLLGIVVRGLTKDEIAAMDKWVLHGEQWGFFSLEHIDYNAIPLGHPDNRIRTMFDNSTRITKE